MRAVMALAWLAIALPAPAVALEMPLRESALIIRGGMNDAETTPARLGVIVEIALPGRGTAPRPSERIVVRLASFVEEIADAARHTDVDVALIKAVIEVESGADPDAVSPKGATGLMQLMPQTARQYGAANLRDTRQNILAGARYLAALLRRFDSIPLALAAYNAGERAVQRHGGRIPPYAETQAYVARVLDRYAYHGVRAQPALLRDERD